MGKKSTHGTILNTKSNHRDFYKINNLKIKKGQEDQEDKEKEEENCGTKDHPELLLVSRVA